MSGIVEIGKLFLHYYVSCYFCVMMLTTYLFIFTEVWAVLLYNKMFSWEMYLPKLRLLHTLNKTIYFNANWHVQTSRFWNIVIKATSLACTDPTIETKHYTLYIPWTTSINFENRNVRTTRTLCVLFQR